MRSFILLFGCCLSLVSQAKNIFGVDKRVEDLSLPIVNSIGILELGEERCAATRVAEKWALTAAHCVVNFNGTARNNIEGLFFRGDGKRTVYKTRLTSAWIGTFSPEDKRYADWALVKMETAVPRSDVPVVDIKPLDFRMVSLPYTVNHSGPALDKNEKGSIHTHKDCQVRTIELEIPKFEKNKRTNKTATLRLKPRAEITDEEKEVFSLKDLPNRQDFDFSEVKLLHLLHDCHTWAGSSGSPIYLQVGRDLQIVGVTVGEKRGGAVGTSRRDEYSDAIANVAVSATMAGSVLEKVLLNEGFGKSQKIEGAFEISIPEPLARKVAENKSTTREEKIFYPYDNPPPPPMPRTENNNQPPPAPVESKVVDPPSIQPFNPGMSYYVSIAFSLQTHIVEASKKSHTVMQFAIDDALAACQSSFRAATRQEQTDCGGNVTSYGCVALAFGDGSTWGSGYGVRQGSRAANLAEAEKAALKFCGFPQNASCRIVKAACVPGSSR